MILLKNANCFTPAFRFEKMDILIDDGLIKETGNGIVGSSDCTVIDMTGKRLIPGLVDIHFHGALGYDIMEATPEQIREIAVHLAREGTTSFLATTVTAEAEEIKRVVTNVRQAISDNLETGAFIVGMHIEGPYLNESKRGTHDTTKIRFADMGEYKELKVLAGDMKLHMTLAPEMENALEFIEYITRDGSTVSIGHSDASIDVVKSALKRGATVFTHLFNGMRGIHHREPGVAGAALLSDAYVELICDGVHVHPDIVKLVYRLKGKDEIVLVTDAMHAKGLGDGRYFFCGSEIIV